MLLHKTYLQLYQASATMILPLFLVLFLATFTHADDVSPACHDKKIHEFPITVKELHAKWYAIVSAYEVQSHYAYDSKHTYGVMDISVIEGKTKLAYWNGLNGNLEFIESKNATFVEHSDHVMLHDPMYGYKSQIYKISDDCIKFNCFNETSGDHDQCNFLFCRSLRGSDDEVEAFTQRVRCKNLNHILLRRNDFEYATKCYSVAHHLDPLDVKSILGVWHMVAKAGKDDRTETEDDPWVEFIMDDESLKIQQGHGSIKSSIKEATVNGSKIIVKHDIPDNTSCVLTFYPTCKDCLLMRHEDGSHGKVHLVLFKTSGKLTPEDMEKFKDNARCFSIPIVNVLQDDHKSEQKEHPENSHSE